LAGLCEVKTNAANKKGTKPYQSKITNRRKATVAEKAAVTIISNFSFSVRFMNCFVLLSCKRLPKQNTPAMASGIRFSVFIGAV
jgi:hypothetical protein